MASTCLVRGLEIMVSPGCSSMGERGPVHDGCSTPPTDADDEVWETRAGLDAIVSRHWAKWSEFRPCEEIADLLKRSAVLQGETHQAGYYVVETDQF